jgi:Fe-S-cluster containining protein
MGKSVMDVLEIMLQAATKSGEDFDHYSQEWLGEYKSIGGKVHCAEGCFSCCDMEVNITLPEALLIANSLKAEHRDIFQQTLKRSLEFASTVTNDREYFHNRRSKIGYCPFLYISGSCGIYSIRPINCRQVFSILPSGFCVDKSLLKMSLGNLLTDYCTVVSQSEVTDGNTHYINSLGNLGSSIREDLLKLTEEIFGFRVSGNILLMIELCYQNSFWEAMQTSETALVNYLKEQKLYHSFLIDISSPNKKRECSDHTPPF